jgi:hypothetical protein
MVPTTVTAMSAGVVVLTAALVASVVGAVVAAAMEAISFRCSIEFCKGCYYGCYSVCSAVMSSIEVLLRWINGISAQVVPVLAAEIATVVGPTLLQAV